MRLSSSSAWLSSSTSCTHARASPGADTGASVRSLVRVSASGECGKVQNSKWSWASTRSSRPSSTSSSGSVRSTPRRRKAGTQRSVTAVTIPSEPSPTRAARSRSPSSRVSVRRSPLPSTSSSASTWALRFCSRAPVPCVPVAIAPASVWASMSPRLGSASPRSSRPRLSAASVIPPSALTSPEAGSASRMRSSRSSRTSVPSVGTHGENEWPDPAARTVRPASAARRTAPATSRADFGCSIATGTHECVRAQLLHMRPRLVSPAMSWEPELEELRRREALARDPGSHPDRASRVERQHAAGKLTVRERIERLLDPGTFHETGALAGVANYGSDGELEAFMPANMVVGQGEADGRGLVVQARRLHDPRRRRGRRDLAEDGPRGADGARPAAAAGAARRRHGRRRLGQVARADGLHLRAVPARDGGRGREHGDRARRGRGARARGGPRRGARGGLALLRDRARQRPAVRRRPAGGRGGDGRVARQGGARRRPRADAGRRGRQRGRRRGRRARAAAALPLLSAGQRLGAAAGRGLHRRARPARGGAAVDRPARPAQALRDAGDPGGGARPRLAVRARRAPRPLGDLRAGPARRPAGRA